MWHPFITQGHISSGTRLRLSRRYRGMRPVMAVVGAGLRTNRTMPSSFSYKVILSARSSTSRAVGAVCVPTGLGARSVGREWRLSVKIFNHSAAQRFGELFSGPIIVRVADEKICVSDLRRAGPRCDRPCEAACGALLSAPGGSVGGARRQGWSFRDRWKYRR